MLTGRLTDLPNAIVRVALTLTVVATSTVGSFSSEGVADAQPETSISGPQIEQLLRANLQAAAWSGADVSQIHCPSTREYRDGDVARCAVPLANGGVQILLVTLFQKSDGWQFAIDIE